jgi:uncharacterized protein (DUF1778 family)
MTARELRCTAFCRTIIILKENDRYLVPLARISMAVAETKTKSERLEARVTPEAKALFQRAADLQGRSLTDFVVESLIDAARRTVRETELADLTRRDRIAFIEALIDPAPAPNARLRRAARRHARFMGNQTLGK